jgi:hypothetical protein
VEGYCQQCIYTDRQKPHKEFQNFRIMIYSTSKIKDVNCYGKQKCFIENKDWQHLSD